MVGRRIPLKSTDKLYLPNDSETSLLLGLIDWGRRGRQPPWWSAAVAWPATWRKSLWWSTPVPAATTWRRCRRRIRPWRRPWRRWCGPTSRACTFWSNCCERARRRLTAATWPAATGRPPRASSKRYSWAYFGFWFRTVFFRSGWPVWFYFLVFRCTWLVTLSSNRSIQFLGAIFFKLF